MSIVKFGEASLQEAVSDGIAGYTALVACKGSFTLSSEDMKMIMVYVGSQFVYDMFFKSWVQPIFDGVFSGASLKSLSDLVTEVLSTATLSYSFKRYVMGRSPSFLREMLFALSASAVADKINKIRFYT